MTVIFGIFLLTLMLITAVAVVHTKNLFVATTLMGIFSLLLAGNFFLLDAADVALTEAAVGAGVSTVLFLSALSLTAEQEKPRHGGRLVALAVVVITTLALLHATLDSPQPGDINAPVHQHVAPWYLEQTPELIGIPNVVTAVLGSFRGYDTLLELVVLVLALIGTLPTAPFSNRTTGLTPSSLVTRMAMHPRQSSRISMLCSKNPWNFMPSFAREPPPTTATLSNTPASTSAQAVIRADEGAAQKFLISMPDAFRQPHISPTALAICHGGPQMSPAAKTPDTLVSCFLLVTIYFISSSN
mgnify:CR=1 FL=1